MRYNQNGGFDSEGASILKILLFSESIVANSFLNGSYKTTLVYPATSTCKRLHVAMVF
jgi:hypothetical protein